MAKKVDETKTFEWRISHIPQILEWVEKQDVEKLREERRNRGKLRSFPNPLLSRNYPQFTQEVSEEGSPDDLPF